MTPAVLASCKKAEEPAPEAGAIPIRIASAITKATEDAFETGDDGGLFVVNEPKSLQPSGNHADNRQPLTEVQTDNVSY